MRHGTCFGEFGGPMRPALALVAAVAISLAGNCTAGAGEVTLKNGFTIEGTPRRLQALSIESIRHRHDDTPSFPFVAVDNGYQRIFVPKLQVAKMEDRDDLSKFETFRLRQMRTGVKHAAGLVVATSPFSADGRRTHKLETSHGEVDIVVGVTKITPKYVSLTGINYQWEYGIATSSVPAAQLDAMIRKVSDPKNPDHRFSIARFYLQAGFYEESEKELASISKDFPELAQRVADARKELKELEHRLIVQELSRRKAAGQYELAHSFALAVPQAEISANILHDVRELIRDYDAGRERIERTRTLLGTLQDKLDDSRLVAALAPLRSAVESQLSLESLDRLQAFFTLANDSTLRPSEKLALAYSGWVVGSASAVTDIGLAVRLWKAQQLVIESLRAETSEERKDRAAEIAALDGVGPESVVKLIRCLPPVIETPGIKPAVATTLQISGRDSDNLPTYGVLLPPEYDWRRSYPMIVALHPAERPAKAELDWWGGTTAKPGMAQRRGYIVIAPEYADEKSAKYNYSVSAHDAVLRAIVNARKRFNVDSDRVFLSGHGMGGDAAFDIGMSHPDQFAGVVPINGVAGGYCKYYCERNAGYTSWYVILGEFDRDTFAANTMPLQRMMRSSSANPSGVDVVLVEFLQRGYESYFEEIERIFDWMEPLRRRKPPRDFAFSVLRPSESRLYWLQAEGLPKSVMESTVLAGPSSGSTQPMKLAGKITPGNTIYLTSGAKNHTVWLSPELVNFKQRLSIQLRSQRKFSGTPQPSIEAMLDDYRLRGDRQALYTVRIDLD